MAQGQRRRQRRAARLRGGGAGAAEGRLRRPSAPLALVATRPGWCLRQFTPSGRFALRLSCPRGRDERERRLIGVDAQQLAERFGFSIEASPRRETGGWAVVAAPQPR